MVECAIVLPVFVLILLATIEACSMIFLRQSLEIGAYEGVRTAIVPGADRDDVQHQCLAIVEQRGVQAATADVSPADIENAPYGTFLTVTVTAPCGANGLLAPLFYSGRTITAEAQMMKEY